MNKLISLFLLMVMVIITSCNEHELNSPPYPPGAAKYKQESSNKISKQEAIDLAEEIAADSITSDTAELQQE